jgi:microsomal epoxide hydrolase
MRIHFTALFSRKRDAIPIILLHGWPGSPLISPHFNTHSYLLGSFLEFLPLLTLLQQEYTPDTLPYHVIIPSLPGFAFSDPPPIDRDSNLEDVAEIMQQLMVNLGFGDGYVAQGGDVGSKIARILGVRFGGCKGMSISLRKLFRYMKTGSFNV